MPRTSDDAKERLTDAAMELIWQNRILERKARYFESATRDAHAQSLIVAPEAKPKAQALFACYQGTLTQARILNKVELLCEFKAITPAG